MRTVNAISISGGKDSTATALKAIEDGAENLRFVFADTGNEEDATIDYVSYLSGEIERLCGQKIETVKANFDRQISNKRRVVAKKWKAEGVSREKINTALSVLRPTGNPFLDLCIWTGRFPSTRRRFCSEQLKHEPLNKYALALLGEFKAVISWQGVRRDESESRKNLPERDVEFGSWEPEPSGLLIYRPILDWKASDCFEQHRKFGIKWNPLYELGMGRVGCMPCIHATKGEIREIERRFPEHFDRIEQWEQIVSAASKRDCSTFMNARVTANFIGTGTSADEIRADTHGIKTYVDYARTERGGRQSSLIHAIELLDVPQCSSVYGLCE